MTKTPPPAQPSPAQPGLSQPSQSRPEQSLSEPSVSGAAALTPAGFVEGAMGAPQMQTAMAAQAASGIAARGKVVMGVLILITGTFLFACQDATTKYLMGHYSLILIIMIRCWALLLAGTLILASAPGGIKANIKTHHWPLQVLRGFIVASQWLFAAYSMYELGLGETTALYEAYPLLCLILAKLILGEAIGWRRYITLIIGFAGIGVMMYPSGLHISVGTMCALMGALLFSFYVVFTRLASHYDAPQTSFFYMGAVSAAMMTPALPFIWQHITPADAGLFVLLGIFTVSAHFCMIKALSLAAVNVLQPFNYSQVVWSFLIGFLVFGDIPDHYMFVGEAMVVCSGLVVLFHFHGRRPKIFVKRHRRWRKVLAARARQAKSAPKI